MTAAWAAIWLADSAEFAEAAAATAAIAAAPAVVFMLTCERFEVLVDGRVESNKPCVAECFLELLLRSGGDSEGAVKRLVALGAGREKF